MTDRATLLHEVDARFWALGYKPGKPLDPGSAQDQKMIPVWEDIFKKVQAEDNAGKLVLSHLDPKIAQSLSDAAVAHKAAEVHLDAAARATDPRDAQANTDAATTAVQVSLLKTREAAMNQPSTVAPKLVQDAVREIAQAPPPPHAPAADHIAHSQTQNGQMLRPEEDPWDSRYAPKSVSPREQPTRPSKLHEQPPRELLYKETNTRFWNRYNYKPKQRLDMSIPEDQKMAKVWMDIFHEVQREANAGKLTLTPDTAPPPSVPPPQPPAPPPPSPPTRPMRPPMQQPPMGPSMQQPMYPPSRPPMYPPMYPPMRPTPPMGMPQRPPMGMPQRLPMEMPQRPPMGPSDAPGTTPGMPQPSTPTEPSETGPAEEPRRFPWGLIVLGVATAAGITYAVTRKPSRESSRESVASSFPPRKASAGRARTSSSASSSPRGARI